jgi:hypothetical protein
MNGQAAGLLCRPRFSHANLKMNNHKPNIPTTMKKYTIFNKTTVCAATACALAIAAWLPNTARAQEPMKPMKGGEHLMMLQHINTPAQAEELKPGDSIAMVCAKCKSVMVRNVTTEKGHIKLMAVGEKHLCPGCGSTITIVGVGKSAKDEVKHVCQKCGSSSAFCCATKPDAAEATKGMDRENK